MVEARTATSSPLVGVAILLAILFNAWLLRSELRADIPDINDMVLHRLLVGTMADTLRSGGEGLDPWVPNIAFGYPVWHAYQPLPHLAGAVAAMLAGGDVRFATSLLLYVLLVFFPLVIFIAARLLGLSAMEGASAALVAPLVNASGRYGLEYQSYVWSGSGLFTQAFAQTLLPLGAGLTWRALRTGRGTIAAGAALAATFLCHSVYGFIAVVTLPVMVLFIPRRGWNVAARATAVLASAAVGVAFFVIPLLIDHEGINRSRWEEPWKWDSYGASKVLSMLVTGELFDGGGVPIVTMTVIAGLLTALLRKGQTGRFLGTAFGLWLLLYFGRATWGKLYDLLPMATDLPQHRLIAGVHLFGILAAGLSIGSAVEWVGRRKGAAWIPAAMATVLLVLTPAILRQIQLMQKDRQWRERTSVEYQREEGDLARLFDAIRGKDRGRVFAGLAGTWGKEDAVGFVPLFALVTSAGFDSTSYLYHAMGAASDLMVLFDQNRPEHYRAFGVRWVVADARRSLPPFLRKEGQWGRFALYRAPGGEALEVSPAAEARPAPPRDHFPISEEWLRGSAVREQVAFVLSPGWPSRSSGPVRGAISSWRQDGGTASAVVTLDRAGVIVLKSTWHPRWRVEIDQQPVRALMVAPGFVAADVPPGRHHVVFRYATQPWRLPLVIVSWLAIAAGMVAERWRLRTRSLTMAAPARPGDGSSNAA